MLKRIALALSVALAVAAGADAQILGSGIYGDAKGAGGGSGFALVGTPVAAAGNPAGTTVAYNDVGANLDIICTTQFTPGSATPTDSLGNTWTPLTQYSGGGSNYGQIFYKYNPTTGSAHTVTFSGAYSAIEFMAFSGAAASPFDQQNGAGGGSISSIQPGAVTPSQSDELIIAGNTNGGSSVSVNDGFTIPSGLSFNDVGSVNLGSACGYLIQGAAAAINPTWSWTGSSNGVAETATFK